MKANPEANAYWRKKDPELTKRATLLARQLIRHALTRGYGNDNQRRSFLAQALTEFALKERGDFYPKGQYKKRKERIGAG